MCIRDSWCGVREGELLALTPADFDFEKRTVTINKSYQRLNKQDVITTPKTPKSNRVIQMPQFLCDELQDYLKQLDVYKRQMLPSPMATQDTNTSKQSPLLKFELDKNICVQSSNTYHLEILHIQSVML